MRSIIQKGDKKCYLCGSPINLHCHHLYFGNPRRKLSERYGLKVYLCYEHHKGRCGVHSKNGHALDLMLKQIGQNKFNEVYPNLNFVKIFGRNYL